MSLGQELGLRLTEAIGAFFGGVCYSILVQARKPAEIVGYVVVGTATGNYMGDAVVKMMMVLPSGLQLGEGGTGFLTGLVAMGICQAIVTFGRKWKPRSRDEV